MPRTGVIYVTTEAARRGFRSGIPTGATSARASRRPGRCRARRRACTTSTIGVDDQEYAPVAGLWELREAVAELYNQLYRRGMPSQYTARERLHLRRRARRAHPRRGRLGHVNLGHFLPDYTAYEELLDIFKVFTVIPILLEGERGYALQRRRSASARSPGRGLSALLLSNPCNPTGKVDPGRRAGALGARWRASSTARC